MDARFEGKRALVTGAGKGIGRAIALALAANGAHTIAISRTAADLGSLKAEDPRIQTAVADVSNWNETRRLVQSLLPIDLLVNNVGRYTQKPAVEITEEELDRLFDTNVKSAVNISQVVARSLMTRKTKGSIVQISSVGALKVAGPELMAFAGTKAALDHMTKYMALEWGPHQIRVNCVNPTAVWTEKAQKQGNNEQNEALQQQHPLQKFAEMKDVTNAVLYLLSEQSDMITGTMLPVDGGLCLT